MPVSSCTVGVYCPIHMRIVEIRCLLVFAVRHDPALRWLSLVFVLLSSWAQAADAPDALIAAAAEGRLTTVRSMLASGADANAVNARGRTALMSAAAYGNAEVVKALLASGADVNLADAAGVTALMEAAAWGHAEVAGMLLTAGAKADTADKNGATAAARARAAGHEDLATRIETPAGGKDKKK